LRRKLIRISPYGGHYFSAKQAFWIDALRATLPTNEPLRTLSLAALISAASQCVAAPGHTAQPFQPTRTAKRFLKEAWDRDVPQRVRVSLELISRRFARRSGKAARLDANEAAGSLSNSDLVFVDPPYSGVHYSRFYHVLETIARGECGGVTGVGRYPAPELRPRSLYSLKTLSGATLDDLLATISSRGASVILTFPDHNCSNGLSGDKVKKMAAKHFRVTEQTVRSKFSTLGGNSSMQGQEAGRAARHVANELILLLRPR
jgi:adenine-specific DNA-methyltransferase